MYIERYILSSIKVYDAENGVEVADIKPGSPEEDSLNYIKPIRTRAEFRTAKRNNKDSIFTLWPATVQNRATLTTVYYAVGKYKFNWGDDKRYRLSAFAEGYYINTQTQMNGKDISKKSYKLLADPLVQLYQPEKRVKKEAIKVETKDDENDDNDANMTDTVTRGPIMAETPVPCVLDGDADTYLNDIQFNNMGSPFGMNNDYRFRRDFGNNNNQNHNHNINY